MNIIQRAKEKALKGIVLTEKEIIYLERINMNINITEE